MRWPEFTRRLPAYLINGIGVATGIALVQLIAGLSGGTVAALTASGGAIFASLADLPNAPNRTLWRVLTAALVGTASTLLVTAVRPWPVAMGMATIVLAFVSMLALAWGPRGGPLSFVAILALVFTMAAPPAHGLAPWLAHAGWTALGGALYVGWALAVSVRLQPRYRTLALAAALDALAVLLRSRAALVADDPQRASGAPPLQEWIQRQVALDERLQTARDFLFPVASQPAEQPRVAALLAAIDLRDTLLASELDIDLLGRNADSERLRRHLETTLERGAAALVTLAEALRLGREIPLEPAFAPTHAAADPATIGGSAPLAQALRNRARHMSEDVVRVQAALRSAAVSLPLSRDELQLFVSAEGWPLAALRPHMTLASPVMRQALRTAVALGCAYFLALALPWASHPHWLVLSVAVVLRGNLEQTLARRDARVAGTVIGCFVVLGLAQMAAPWLSTLVFLLAVATAHSFVLTRYLVTAAAATVMALLQAHMAYPAGGFGIGERLADTVLGALLAWGFSYVLPSWERRGLTRLVARVLASQQALAAEALRWPQTGAADLPLRLARREVYDAIGAIAAAAQRTGAEPQRVQVPLYALATLLTRSHVLLAQLAAVRMLLMREGGRLDPGPAQAALADAANRLENALTTAPDESAPNSAPTTGVDALAAPERIEALQSWLDRRLQIAAGAASGVAQAARAVAPELR